MTSTVFSSFTFASLMPAGMAAIIDASNALAVAERERSNAWEIACDASEEASVFGARASDVRRRYFGRNVQRAWDASSASDCADGRASDARRAVDAASERVLADISALQTARRVHWLCSLFCR